MERPDAAEGMAPPRPPQPPQVSTLDLAWDDASVELGSPPPPRERAQAVDTLTPVLFDSDEERESSFDEPPLQNVRWSSTSGDVQRPGANARLPKERRHSVTGSFLDFVTESTVRPSSRRQAYEITLEQYQKLTIIFGEELDGRISVKSFGVSNARDDAALGRLADLVHVGDCVTALDGVSTEQMDFQDFRTTFAARKAAGEPTTLSLAPPGESLNMTRSSSLSRAEDGDILEAKRWIQAHKSRFYTSPPDTGERLIQCYLVRHRGEFLHSFHLMREDTDAFVLAATCDSNMKSGFVFSTLQHTHLLKALKEIPTEEDCAAYVGCMTNNYLCTEFVVHDHTIKAAGLHRGRLPSQHQPSDGRSGSFMGSMLNAIRTRLPSATELVTGTSDAVLGADGRPHEVRLGRRQNACGVPGFFSPSLSARILSAASLRMT
eukprot:scaffold441_cov241-Pinguiococcus_pyrenoidosus.AAC.2